MLLFLYQYYNNIKYILINLNYMDHSDLAFNINLSHEDEK